MDRILLGLMLAAAFAGAVAGKPDSAENGARQHCERVADYARTVMEARQSGVRMVDAMPSKDVDAQTKRAMEAIVMAAYERPRFGTKGYQQKAVTDFEDSIFLACLKER